MGLGPPEGPILCRQPPPPFGRVVPWYTVILTPYLTVTHFLQGNKCNSIRDMLRRPTPAMPGCARFFFSSRRVPAREVALRVELALAVERPHRLVQELVRDHRPIVPHIAHASSALVQRPRRTLPLLSFSSMIQIRLSLFCIAFSQKEWFHEGFSCRVLIRAEDKRKRILNSRHSDGGLQRTEI